MFKYKNKIKKGLFTMEQILNVIYNDREYITELEDELKQANKYIEALEKTLIEQHGYVDPLVEVEYI